VIGILIATAVIGVPALAFTLWPLLVSRGARRTFLAVPPDAREQLLEQKQRLLRSLRELAFEHEAGHVSDDDYAELRNRYESETAAVLTELDRLRETSAPRTSTPTAAPARRAAWRHPAAVAASVVALVAFGVALGAGIVRYATPDNSMAGTGAAGMPALAGLPPAASAPAGDGSGRPRAPPRPPHRPIRLLRRLPLPRREVAGGRGDRAGSRRGARWRDGCVPQPCASGA